MKKLLFGTLLLALVLVLPIPTMAGVNVDINISLPPPIAFAAPPELIVLPGTYIYVVPDADADIFFYGGWWWRPWQGRWYRSHYYNSGWGYYQSVPSFYSGIPSSWRNDYRNHRWGGQQWNYQRIPQQQVQRDWQRWEKNKYWEKQNTWGVQGLKPQTRSQQPYQTIQPKSPVKPQSREVRTQQPRAQSQTVKQQVRGTAKPQQSKPQERKPEKGQEEKKDRK